jgi:hypothetical protein
VKARSFADECQIGVWGPARKDALGPPAVELAAPASGGLLREELKPCMRVRIARLDRGIRERVPNCRHIGPRWKPQAAERFLPEQELLSARDEIGKLVFGVGRHARSSIGRFR